DFQDGWVRSIPNRSYANVPPVPTGGKRGSFIGSILEETQPLASFNMGFDSIKAAMGVQYVFVLVLIGAWCVLLSAAASAVATDWVGSFPAMSRMEIVRVMLVVAAIISAAVVASEIGHLLWSRMYFKSRIFWITLEGTFQDAELRIGNSFTGNAQSRSQLTRVEDATLRVWVADIESVSFGKDGKRFIMAMAPVDEIAKSTADRLKHFAFEQSSIVAPTSSRDLSKLQAIASMNDAYQSGGMAAIENNLRERLALARNGMGESVEKQLPPNAGIVKFFDDAKGYGFISCDDGIERFFNTNSFQVDKAVKRGDRVTFEHRDSERGPKALRVEKMA
ncbi:MAG: cold shock domain-containing protein, partial [Burkholderiaceae bacterium]|nr:cold shock domain-containing protein [Burkholderiaceae bacterium]